MLKSLHETPYYIWVTQGDGKVRASHAANDGKVFAWEHPPSTGNPGEDKPLVRAISSASVTTYFPNGSSQTRMGGSRAWRNNNPGNLRAGAFANAHGAIGSAGGFAVFPDEATGQSASAALLRTSAYAQLTIDEGHCKAFTF